MRVRVARGPGEHEAAPKGALLCHTHMGPRCVTNVYARAQTSREYMYKTNDSLISCQIYTFNLTFNMSDVVYEAIQRVLNFFCCGNADATIFVSDPKCATPLIEH